MRPVIAILMLAGLGVAMLSCAAAAPIPASAPAPVATPAPKPAEDTCGATKLQYLVGKSKSEIPPAPKDARWRISCSSCMVTQDYSPERLDIVFDTTTGIVTAVRCG